MLEMQMGKVVEILSERDGIQEVLLETGHPVKKAVNYIPMTGKAEVGDMLYLNTTAASLSLGTGGFHFAMMNTSCKNLIMTPGGHGMKLRYTPFQIKVPFAEEELENKKEIYNSPLCLKNKLVFFAELHSMIPPLCAYIRYYSNREHRIAYIMTDHGALPLVFSKNIAYLKEKQMLDTVITIGSAFGGEYECVNIYTGLQTAAYTANCDIILVAMGPGIAGTGTRYGFSGLDMGFYLDLAYHLGGQSWYIPRISFAEERDRHYGISHHTLTILGEIAKSPVPIVLPILKKDEMRRMLQQLRESNILNNHKLYLTDGKDICEAMEHYRISITTMGRGIDKDPAFFYAIGAAARKGLSLF